LFYLSVGLFGAPCRLLFLTPPPLIKAVAENAKFELKSALENVGGMLGSATSGLTAGLPGLSAGAGVSSAPRAAAAEAEEEEEDAPAANDDDDDEAE